MGEATTDAKGIPPFSNIFWIALVLNVLIAFRSSGYWKRMFSGAKEKEESVDPQEKSKHNWLIRIYLMVYLTATLSDWLQGPYVYALYDAYGYSRYEIAVLFVAGFGSSMIFGSFVGGMADWGGRRRFVVLFALIYAASCVTKHFKDFNILMLGRLLGGIATSLLFSVFEAWLIRAHADRKLGKNCLGQSFSWAAFGNSIVAIMAGLLANKAAGVVDMTPISGEWIYVGGFLGPFDIALFVLVICGFLALSLWEENYGDESLESGGKEGSSDDGRGAPNWYSGLKNAFVATMRSRDILLCGLVSSIFEGSMYIFVFMWTPSIQQFTGEDTKLPFGIIFATFMVSCMAGSSLFSILIQYFKGEALCVGLLAVAAISMATTALAPNATASFCAMNVFEVCVGMYWPIMGTMKGTIVPEDKRAAIYNLYRIPLNFIVLFSLLTKLTPTQSFTLNCCLLAIATVMQFALMTRRLNMNNMKDLTARTQQEAAEEAQKGLLTDEEKGESSDVV